MLLTSALAGVGRGQADDASHFVVMLRGTTIGFEDVRLARTANGWLISSSGRQNVPFEFVINRFEMAYAPDWQPQTLGIEGTTRGQLITLGTTFGLTTAVSDMMQGGQKGTVTHQVSPRTVVLPNNYFGAYEALAARLGAAEVGARFPIYIAPQAEITATVDRIGDRRMVGPNGALQFRQFDLTFTNPSGPVAIEIWIDARNRFARLVIPGASLAVVRDDIASVTIREETVRNAGDTDASIPSMGFNLAATVTKPRDASGRMPAVILVAGSGPQDRDETVFGIPIFGQLAGAIADAGFFVVRYDKRGVGQSGGRIERVTLADYTEDVLRVVEWLRKRKDIDSDRIAVVGHSEGGAVALLAGSRGDRIAALGLLAAPGQTGREITLWQQQHELSKVSLSAGDKQAKTALQLRVMDAVASGKGWDAVPDEVRRQADTAWFKSWLTFDPAPVIAKTRQPILIIQGSLDTQIPTPLADRLESMSLGRKDTRATSTRKVILSGINHLLVEAKTGEVEEYSRLATKAVAPEVSSALTAWLKEVLAKKK
jgi:hypothetical protein